MGDHRGVNNPNWKGGLVIGSCLQCGAETRVKPSHAKKGKGKFCSTSCSTRWYAAQRAEVFKQARIKKTCVVCGKEMLVKPSHADVQGTYCSRTCMSSGYKSALRGVANPNYRHGMSHTGEPYREAQKRWRVANRDRVRILNSHTKAARRKAKGRYTPKDIAYLMRLQRGECVLCSCLLKDGYHVDHRIPIARGGHNFVGNLQLLCPTCNMKKNALFMVELKYKKR